MSRLLILVVLMGLGPTATHAAILIVEQDGSGDFIEIQAAVDAAADGDTLQVGPGRWDAMQSYSPGGWTTDVIVAIQDKDLVIVGSGQGETIIGPEVPPHFSIPGPIAVWVSVDCSLIIRDLTITNMRDGLYFYGSELLAESVQFLACELGSSAWGEVSTTYLNCRFDECTDIGILGTPRVSNLLIRNCRFEATYGLHVDLQNIENIMIDGCEFLKANRAIQFDGGSCVGIVQNCMFSGGRTRCIVATGYSDMSLYGNEIYDSRVQLIAANHARVTGRGNVFNGTFGAENIDATILCSIGILDLQDNHILRGDAPHAVWFQYFEHTELIEQHLEYNYWGTSSPDSVAAWIWDERDNPELNIVTFIEPFHSQPVANEDLSFGNLKKLYR